MRKVYILLYVFILVVCSGLVNATLDDAFAYYSFDDDDTSGTTVVDGNTGDYNGTIVGDPTTGINGKLGEAYDYDGSGDYITTTFVPSTGVGNWTITSWINVTLSDNTTKFAIYAWGIHQESKEIIFTVKNGDLKSEGYNFDVGWNEPAINDGDWHFVAYLNNGTQGKDGWLYVDGTLYPDTVGNTRTLALVDTNKFRIGDGQYPTGATYGQYFKGQIDEMGIWKRALSPSEVDELYNSGVGYNPFGTVAPTISDVCCTSPVPDDCAEPYTTSDPTPTFNWTTDITAECFLSDDNATWISATTTNATYHIGTINESQALSVGSPSVYAMCNSTVGSKGYDEWEMNITDVTYPNVTLLYPSDNNINDSSTITFGYNVTEDIRLDNCSLYLNTSGVWEINQTNTSPTNNANNNFVLTNFVLSSWLWNIECCDNSSNCAFDLNRTLTIETYLKGNATDSDNNLISGALISIMLNNTPNTVVANVTSNSTGGWKALVDHGVYVIYGYAVNNGTLNPDGKSHVVVT